MKELNTYSCYNVSGGADENIIDGVRVDCRVANQIDFIFFVAGLMNNHPDNSFISTGLCTQTEREIILNEVKDKKNKHYTY